MQWAHTHTHTHLLPEAVLLKGLLGDRTDWVQLAVELKGFGKSESEREKVWL